MKPKTLFLILGLTALTVIAVSWYLFHWTTTLGSLLLLLVAAITGVVVFSNNLLNLYKNWISLRGQTPPSSPASPTTKQTQTVEDSDFVDQDQQGHGAVQVETVKRSSHVSQKQH